MPKIKTKPSPSALQSKLAASKVRGQKQEPLWKGPEIDGVTQSLLSRFLVCPERFRLYAVEGLAPTESFNHRLEFGNMWHLCEENHAAHKPWLPALTSYCQELCLKYRTEQPEIEKWFNVCKVQFPIYVDYWSKQHDEENRTPIMQEESFCVDYNLPTGQTVKLRGKYDSVDLIGKGKKAGIYLKENKTPGSPDQEQLQKQLDFDQQTMLYLCALETMQGERFSAPIKGVRYNVIRRPLSGGKGTIIRHKAHIPKGPKGKYKPEETWEAYYNRLGKDVIKADPAHFFMRWKVEVSAHEIKRFKTEYLNPILLRLCNWWDWIRENPFNPWREYNNIHYRTPYGIYNPLLEGRSTGLDHYLATNNPIGLSKVKTLFPELEP